MFRFWLIGVSSFRLRVEWTKSVDNLVTVVRLQDLESQGCGFESYQANFGPVVRLQDLESQGCGFESYQANCGPVVRLQDLQSQGCGFESYQANRWVHHV